MFDLETFIPPRFQYLSEKTDGNNHVLQQLDGKGKKKVRIWWLKKHASESDHDNPLPADEAEANRLATIAWMLMTTEEQNLAIEYHNIKTAADKATAAILQTKCKGVCNAKNRLIF